ncbi:hypothetical protein HPB51_027233 [Rhipicephalus microplus]|uniref:Uncharacterized protein n=1 Tax=Rhipicephalus microplus TaxID=6941 RepID=A0A9J6D0P8_RHIMP|nr:hypothetical protein HPB51_027233 [Rhipicephalus microplus]
MHIVCLSPARRLNRYVRHFEPLSYEPRRVHREHVRVRRSLGGSSSQHGIVYFRFQGFDRQGDTTKREDPHPRDPSSRVYGGLHDGVFEGSIQSRWGRFYVEGAHKFFARRTPFHSVMYAAKDARIPDAGWCGVNSETTRWMQELAASTKLAERPSSRVQDVCTMKHRYSFAH